MTATCPHCHHPLRSPESRFCTSCGAAVTPVQPPSPTSAPVSPVHLKPVNTTPTRFRWMPLVVLVFVIATGLFAWKRFASPPTVDVLIQAITRNDMAAVKQILAANPSLVNTRNKTVECPPGKLCWNGFPYALDAAISVGNPQIVRELLDSGADVSAKTTDGLTCLDYATTGSSADPEIVKMLIAKSPVVSLNPSTLSILRLDMQSNSHNIEPQQQSRVRQIITILEQAGVQIAR